MIEILITMGYGMVYVLGVPLFLFIVFTLCEKFPFFMFCLFLAVVIPGLSFIIGTCARFCE